jgi:hypothetical protein
MATIKSYTDLPQSKILSKILPLASADMWYQPKDKQGDDYMPFPHINKVYANELPCWSLAALLGVLPAECECMSLEHINYGNNHKKYFMSYIGGENTEDYDNPVDACVEMIIKLNELNLL